MMLLTQLTIEYSGTTIYFEVPHQLTSKVVMDRINATATAVNCILVCQPQPRCGCEYHNCNRNRGYFFQQLRIFKKKIIQEKLYFTYFQVRIVIMSSQLTIFFVIVQKRTYGSIYFSSLIYLNFFNTYY